MDDRIWTFFYSTFTLNFFRRTKKKHCEKYDQNMCIAAGLIWQLVIHSCLFFVSFSISRRDGENDGLLAGVPLILPPSQAVSRPNFLPLPFRTPATQSSSVSDYRLITCLLRTSLPRRGSRQRANVRFKLRHFQNERRANKNNSKQFLWIELRELTDFRVVIVNSNDK